MCCSNPAEGAGVGPYENTVNTIRFGATPTIDPETGKITADNLANIMINGNGALEINANRSAKVTTAKTAVNDISIGSISWIKKEDVVPTGGVTINADGTNSCTTAEQVNLSNSIYIKSITGIDERTTEKEVTLASINSGDGNDLVLIDTVDIYANETISVNTGDGDDTISFGTNLSTNYDDKTNTHGIISINGGAGEDIYAMDWSKIEIDGDDIKLGINTVFNVYIEDKYDEDENNEIQLFVPFVSNPNSDLNSPFPAYINGTGSGESHQDGQYRYKIDNTNGKNILQILTAGSNIISFEFDINESTLKISNAGGGNFMKSWNNSLDFKITGANAKDGSEFSNYVFKLIGTDKSELAILNIGDIYEATTNTDITAGTEYNMKLETTGSGQTSKSTISFTSTEWKAPQG